MLILVCSSVGYKHVDCKAEALRIGIEMFEKRFGYPPEAQSELETYVEFWCENTGERISWVPTQEQLDRNPCYHLVLEAACRRENYQENIETLCFTMSRTRLEVIHHIRSRRAEVS